MKWAGWPTSKQKRNTQDSLHRDGNKTTTRMLVSDPGGHGARTGLGENEAGTEVCETSLCTNPRHQDLTKMGR